MIYVFLPLGIRIGLFRHLRYRPLFSLNRCPRSIEFWCLWLHVALTWYESNRRGQNAVHINGEEAFAVFPR